MHVDFPSKIVGIVYLATSISRDVRLLRAGLLEQEEREKAAKAGLPAPVPKKEEKK